MATNSIHFLDLFSWFVGDSKIKLNGELLSNEILENAYLESSSPEWKEYYKS